MGEVQTKRTIQRHGSTSSNGSAAGPGRLKRQGSSGSMTERTFREQSPSRPVSRARDDDPPPMPALPKAYAASAVPNAKRRPASAEPLERIASPPLKLPGGRGVSLDRGPGVLHGPPKKQGGSRKPSLSNIVEQERVGNKGSVNFSRPMSPTISPPVSPVIDRGPHTQPTPKSRAVSGPASLSSGEVQDIQYSVQEVANAPVKKKKKKVVSDMTEGSHLEAGGLGKKPVGSALESRARQEPSQQAISPTPATSQTVTKRKKKRASASQDSTTAVPVYSSDSESSEQSFSDRPRTYNTRAAGLLTKQPSIVREDREGEELEEKKISPPTRKSEIVENGHVQNGSAQNGIAQTGVTKAPIPGQDASLLTTVGTIATKDPDPMQGLESKDEAQSEQTALKPLTTADLSQESKRASLSPTRSARFSSQLTFETPGAIRHQPPPRSVSPAKSALKQSPSPRGPSPAGVYRPGQAPSEASDTLSVASDEGNRSSVKRKKSVRVSFDDDPTIVGEAAPPASAASSPIILSPQNKLQPGKSWFGLGRDKRKGGQVSDDSEDDVMKPVPALPSFGSIRERKGGPEPAATPQESLQEQSSASSSAQTLQNVTSSSDHALGSIVAKDFASHIQAPSAQPSNEPLPPEVTSVEGSGYQSDTESSSGSVNADLVQGPVHISQEHTTRSSSVPTIAVQPATPGIESPEPKRDSWFYMPGGFPLSSESLSRAADTPVPDERPVAPDSSPAVAGISEPEPEVSAQYHEPASPVVGQVAESILQQTSTKDAHADDSDDSGDSIYSDAAEDALDFEGDGFGSINAIVDSPAIAPVKLSQVIPPVDSKAISTKDEREEGSGKGWEGAQVFWSAVNGSRKAAPKESDSKLDLQETSTRSLAEPVNKQETTSEPANEPSRPRSAKAEAPRAAAKIPTSKPKSKPAVDKPTMRKSMREAAPSPQEPAKAFRSSMRDGPRQTSAPQTSEPYRMASSMRAGAVRGANNNQRGPTPGRNLESSEPRGALQKKQRPAPAGSILSGKDYNANGTSHPPLPTRKSAAKPSTTLPQSGLAISSHRRTASNGSDSSSSFKKARKSSTSSGRYSMRRSMRSDAGQGRPQSEVIPSSSFSVRSASPTPGANRRPLSSSGFGMRTSLRGPANSMRSSSPPSSNAFGKGTKTKATKSAKPARHLASRFGNSSDEDEGRRTFSSRFADSSDEDEPSKLKFTPVRGIPKRIDEGDSTDLEDSEDEAKQEVKSKPILKQLSTNEGSALASGSLRQNGAENGNGNAPGGSYVMSKSLERENKKKPSFFGSLGRRRDKSSKVLKADVESAARRDTPLERTKLERTLLPSPAGLETNTATTNTPNETPADSPTQSPRSPKLQRRHTPQRVMSDSWPLPGIPSAKGEGKLSDAAARPMTSDGSTGPKTGPLTGGREFSTSTAGEAAVGRSGKKKRFPLLRKAFGLHD